MDGITSEKYELWQRIAEIRQRICDGNNTNFAAKIGKNTTYTSQLCNGSKPAGKKMLEIILEAFPEVRPAWLHLGEGPMMKTDEIDFSQHSMRKEHHSSSPTVNNGIVVQGDGGGNTYYSNSDLMQIVISQQKTILELTEQNKKLIDVLANKL
ncbi:MAG: hypothetical protein IKJ78_05930 [Bacteroidales bacterium]|nr:hypothetical protein [Bacteroidales bacterium]